MSFSRQSDIFTVDFFEKNFCYFYAKLIFLL